MSYLNCCKDRTISQKLARSFYSNWSCPSADVSCLTFVVTKPGESEALPESAVVEIMTRKVPFVSISPAHGFQLQNASAVSDGNGSLLFFGQVYRADPDDGCSQWSRMSTEQIFEHLKNLSTDCIIDEIDKLHGAWALVYYRNDLKQVFIGRDIFGRKSLLWLLNEKNIQVSPLVVGNEMCWSEVPCGTLVVLNIEDLWNQVIVYTAQEDPVFSWTIHFKVVLRKNLEGLRKRLLAINSEPSISSQSRHETFVPEFLEQFGEALKRCLNSWSELSTSVAVLFSGGIDSLLIALLVQHYLPPACVIDLINVSCDEKSEDFSGAPDRRRGIQAYKFLKLHSPDVPYRLILVNVSRAELTKCRLESIASTIAPSCSVLDDSIGCVQWFAARGEGLLYEEDKATEELVSTRSVACITLVGSGADELFGGYMRHRHCFIRGGRNAVLDELKKELKIIGERNLGRDDRVASCHSRNTMAPYLDDFFVEWVNSLPLEVKVDLTKQRGVGEKMIIRRTLKYLRVPEDLYSVPKQAMQFGTRIAHLENSTEKGSDVCSRLQIPNADFQSAL